MSLFYKLFQKNTIEYQDICHVAALEPAARRLSPVAAEHGADLANSPRLQMQLSYSSGSEAPGVAPYIIAFSSFPSLDGSSNRAEPSRVLGSKSRQPACVQHCLRSSCPSEQPCSLRTCSIVSAKPFAFFATSPESTRDSVGRINQKRLENVLKVHSRLHPRKYFREDI